MIQSLDVPVVSLAVPNIHKLNNITSDDLSCMWTVFTKCKDNLENGRRLENLSWRLWYRESLIEKAHEQHVRTPIPIQSNNNNKNCTDNDDYFSYASSASASSSAASSCESTLQTPPSLKHMSPSSFKRMISSLDYNPIEKQQQQQRQQQPQLLPTPTSTPPSPCTTPAATAAVAQTNTSVVQPPPPPPSSSQQPSTPKLDAQPMAVVAPQPKKPFSAPKPTRKFFVSDDDEEEEEEEDDDDAALRVTAMAATGNNNNTMDEDGCWSTVRTYDQECCTPTFANHRYDSSCLTPNASETDFIKKTPTLIAKQQQQPRPSLLSAMLTRQPPAAPQPQQKPSSASIMNRNSHHRRQRQRRLTACGASQEPAELSQSLKYCVDWEQRQNAVSRDMDPTLLLDLYHQRGSRPRPTYDNHCWESFRGW